MSCFAPGRDPLHVVGNSIQGFFTEAVYRCEPLLGRTVDDGVLAAPAVCVLMADVFFAKQAVLKKVGILENSARGVWALTTVGRELQEINSDEIVKKVREMTLLKMKDTKEISLEDHNLENDGVDTPDEIQTWREKLKNVLKNLKPDAFERLTQRLLRESGFTQVKVTGKTGDGGIDGMGIIKLNGIISFHMLFQCKRYTGSVSAGEIRDFRGAMQGRADKGLFITTGKFSAPAIEEANRPGATPIDLVDGDELVEKLRELQLGVAPVNDYVIDDAWFLSI